MYQLGGALFFGFSCFFLCFISQPGITVYTSFFAFAWSSITISDLHVCIFIIFSLQSLPYIYFMVASGLKCIHFNF